MIIYHHPINFLTNNTSRRLLETFSNEKSDHSAKAASVFYRKIVGITEPGLGSGWLFYIQASIQQKRRKEGAKAGGVGFFPKGYQNNAPLLGAQSGGL